jgi:SET domain-containing protein
MLKPSPLHGIGVFAITAIQKGERKIFSDHESEWIEVSKEEVDALPQHAKSLVENHCLFNETHYYIPEYGFKILDLAVYLNHSDQPNLISINDGEFFEAIRDIEAGEELLIDYGTIVDSEE